jgi:hypothetical protein
MSINRNRPIPESEPWQRQLRSQSPIYIELESASSQVTYSTGSFGSKSNLTNQDANGSQSFSGDQVNIVQTPIGCVVTVGIRRTVDTGSTIFSMLIPSVNQPGPGQAVPVHTHAITTGDQFSIIAGINRGQTELYKFTPLTGTANHIVF